MTRICCCYEVLLDSEVMLEGIHLKFLKLIKLYNRHFFSTDYVNYAIN